MYRPVATELIESWREIASLSGVPFQLEIHSDHSLPATAPSRNSSGWSMVYPAGSAYRVETGAGLRVAVPALEPRDEGELLLWAGPVSAMVMWCGGILPLHAAGLTLGGRVAAVVAPPGGGKSTLAAMAGARAIPVQGDDLLGVTESGILLPRAGSLRIDPRPVPPAMKPEFLLQDGRGWFRLAPPPPARFGSLLVLRRGPDTGLVPVEGHRRLALLLSAGFLSRYDAQVPPGWERRLLDFCADLPVWELQVPDGLRRLADAWPEIYSLIQQSLS